MSCKPCDQFAADILDVQEKIFGDCGIPILLELSLVEQMVEACEQQHRLGKIVDSLETVLWMHEPFQNDIVREAYRRVLDKIFKRRLGARRSQDSRHGRWAPFAPR